jgi:hypothetical protein
MEQVSSAVEKLISVWFIDFYVIYLTVLLKA